MVTLLLSFDVIVALCRVIVKDCRKVTGVVGGGELYFFFLYKTIIHILWDLLKKNAIPSPQISQNNTFYRNNNMANILTLLFEERVAKQTVITVSK